MWKIRTFSGTAWSEQTPFREPELPAAPTSQAARNLASQVLPASLKPLVRHLDQEIKAVISRPQTDGAATLLPFATGARDAIELWNARAAEEAREYNWTTSSGKIEALEEALALYPEGAKSGDTRTAPSVIAWHDRTFLILPITSDSPQQFEVEYLPSMRDENRVERLRHRYATPEHELETILDWRGYFGRQSAVMDGWTQMRRQGHGYVGSVIGTFGFVVLHVIRRLTKPPHPISDRDPRASSRLIQMCEAYPFVAENCPDLSRADRIQGEHATIFVHGTASCGIQGLKDIPLPQNHPIFRFEHDTFRPIKENGGELVQMIQTKVQAKQLFLVAHSRGGLVARWAADELVRNGFPAQIQVATFGTPHKGTPLVAMGGESLNLLYKLGEGILNGIPVATPLGKAYPFLVKAPALPPGIEAMSENSDGLSTMNAYGDPSYVCCWGSKFDLSSKRSGFGVFVTGALLGAMNGIPNDLVVPAQSALGFGAPQPLLDCSHTQYFEQPAVQKAILDFPPGPIKLLRPLKLKTKAQASAAS